MVDKIANDIVDKAKEVIKKKIDEAVEKGKQHMNEKLFKKQKENSIGKVVVCGLAGQGKSNLINKILNKNVANSIGVAGGSQGVTKNITEYRETLPNGLKIKLFDTPGIGDLDVKLEELKNQFESTFCNKNVTAFLFVKRIDDNRVMSDEYASINICEACLSEQNNALNHVIVVFSYYDKLEDKSQADNVAKKIIAEYNQRVKRKGNCIDKYVLFDNTNPQPAINQILNLLKQYEYKLHIGNNFLMDYALDILKEYNIDVNCFSPSSFVTKRALNGEIIIEKLSNINIGDLVETKLGFFEPVLTVSSHKGSLFTVKWIKIMLPDLRELILEVTQNHMLYVRRKSEDFLIPAHKIELQDEIEVKGESKLMGKVVDIKHLISRSVVNIRTPSRRLIVNNIFVSCDVEEDLGSLGGFLLVSASKLNKNLPQRMSVLVNNIYNGIRRIKKNLSYN